MSKNASIPAKTLPDGVTEAAVMESIAENPYIGGFLEWKEKYGGGTPPTLSSFVEYCIKKENGTVSDSEVYILNPETQILQDYLSCNPQAGSYEILDVESGGGKVGNKILIGGQQADGTRSYYVGFQGTQEDEWYDNAEGMVKIVTSQQVDAAQYFDRMVEDHNIMIQDQVIVTGHSKGGNKAQYVTMASENADLVDSCIALDGQGFSPEAVEQWKQYPGMYEERRNKIILVAGKNDFVHVLGERIAANTYYIDYFDSSPDAPEILCACEVPVVGGLLEGQVGHIALDLGQIMTYHFNEYLFQNTWDDEHHHYVFSSQLQGDANQSKFSQFVQNVNDYLMSLPPGERLSSATAIMSLFAKEGTLDGYEATLTDWISTLITVYELLRNNGSPPDPLLESIGFVINSLRYLRNQWEQYRAAKAQAAAQSMAQDEPYIYIDTRAWNDLSIIVSRLGNIDYSGIQKKLFNIQTQLDNIDRSIGRVLQSAHSILSETQEALAAAGNAISEFLHGDIIGGIYATIDMAKEAWDVFESLANTAQAIINAAQVLVEAVWATGIKVGQALSLISTDDTIRKLGDYLAYTARDFQSAEQQNIRWLCEWGV